MATVNAVGNSLTGSTGSGNFIGGTSPTLVTPGLGVSTATSINFGVTALNAYSEGVSWTPTITFATAGDLTVSYAAQTGFYTLVGRVCYVNIHLSFTPTYTTATGAFRVSMPLTGVTASNRNPFNTVKWISNYNWSGKTYQNFRTSTATVFSGGATGSATSSAGWNTGTFPTGVNREFYASIAYFIA